jgi:hypothetical protein
MKKVSVSKYIEGVESIYEEMPAYEEGHDGSDGKCDCIGMCRGGLERAGATGVTNMRGTNQAARRAIENLRKIETDPVVQVGDVVLKTRDKDNPEMPLPDRYRKGGSDYDPNIGEINFTHIGTVTSTNPLEITHMTSPTAEKDKSLKGWSYSGQLPWVEYGDDPGPDPEPVPKEQYAIVYSENGKPVKMRAKPSTSCRLWWEVPVGSEVLVHEKGPEWCKITWAGQDGYMMTRFLHFEGSPEGQCTVTIPGLTIEQAKALIAEYPNGYITAG